MPLLSDKDRAFLVDHLEGALVGAVRILFFTQSMACQFCKETEAILGELADLSDKISLSVYDFVADKAVADEYAVDKIPATVVMSDVDHGVRFFGIPSGYEFTSLVEAVIDVSKGTTDLSAETLASLAQLQDPIHMQVYVTPTCPYCPAAVRMAHSLAIASDMITADMVESVEFPHLANKYRVQGVPQTVINETTFLEGAAPEPLLVAKVKEAAGLMTAQEVEELLTQLSQGQTPQAG